MKGRWAALAIIVLLSGCMTNPPGGEGENSSDESTRTTVLTLTGRLGFPGCPIPLPAQSPIDGDCVGIVDDPADPPSVFHDIVLPPDTLRVHAKLDEVREGVLVRLYDGAGYLAGTGSSDNSEWTAEDPRGFARVGNEWTVYVHNRANFDFPIDYTLTVTFTTGLPQAPERPGIAQGTVEGWALECRGNSTAWRQSCTVRATQNPGHKTETWLAVNPTNPLNVVVGAKDMDPSLSGDCVWSTYAVTFNGGVSWVDVSPGGAFANRELGSPFYGYSCSTDPMFRFSPDGRLYVYQELYNLVGQDAYHLWAGQVPVFSPVPPGFKPLLLTSLDGGLTFSNIIPLQPDVIYVSDAGKMVINPVTGTVLVALLGYDAGCRILASRDGGQTAAIPVYIPPPDPAAQALGGCTALTASPTGHLVVRLNARLFHSDDDGRTWPESSAVYDYQAAPSLVPGSSYRVTDPTFLAYDASNGPHRGRLHAVYANQDAAWSSNLYAVHSDDDGRTWSEAHPVKTTIGVNEWAPNTVVAADGSVHVVFFDDEQVAPEQTLIHVIHAASNDGGVTWEFERVTDLPFDGDVGQHQDGGSFVGDYIGIDAASGHVWMGFPDDVDGVLVSAAAHVIRT